MEEIETREAETDSPRDSSSTAQSIGMPAGAEGWIAKFNQLHAETNNLRDSTVNMHSDVQVALLRVFTIGEDLPQHLGWAGKA